MTGDLLVHVRVPAQKNPTVTTHFQTVDAEPGQDFRPQLRAAISALQTELELLELCPAHKEQTGGIHKEQS